MKAKDFIPTFTLVMGGAGSGKNYYIEHDSELSKAWLIDVDAVKIGMALDAAIKQIKPMLEEAFQSGINVAHPTTGSNLKGQINKILLAKKYDYRVEIILIDTDPQRAAQQVQFRVDQGGHNVEADKIASSNAKARENFEQLKQYADESKIVSR
jgi:predicted ABC-type ATPase